jgi:4-oxalocrotonate tautomerase
VRVCPSGTLELLEGSLSLSQTEEVYMPFIKIEAGKMNKETKEKLICAVTKAASENLGIPEESFTILLKENETDNWGVGGKVLTRVLEERVKKQ